MKTATLPSIRVAPELRHAAESVLREGESLSAFVEQAIRQTIADRQADQAFMERGLRARDQARQTGAYVDASTVVEQLQRKLDARRAERARA